MKPIFLLIVIFYSTLIYSQSLTPFENLLVQYSEIYQEIDSAHPEEDYIDKIYTITPFIFNYLNDDFRKTRVQFVTRFKKKNYQAVEIIIDSVLRMFVDQIIESEQKKFRKYSSSLKYYNEKVCICFTRELKKKSQSVLELLKNCTEQITKDPLVFEEMSRLSLDLSSDEETESAKYASIYIFRNCGNIRKAITKEITEKGIKSFYTGMLSNMEELVKTVIESWKSKNYEELKKAFQHYTSFKIQLDQLAVLENQFIQKWKFNSFTDGANGEMVMITNYFDQKSNKITGRINYRFKEKEGLYRLVAIDFIPPGKISSKEKEKLFRENKDDPSPY